MASDVRVNPTLGPEHFETVLDAVPEAVLTVDRSFVITNFNRMAERLTGFRRNEVVGKHCYEICRSPACRTTTDCPMTISLRNGAPPLTMRELFIVNRQGERTPVNITFTPLRGTDGTVVGGIEAFHAPTTEASNGNGHGNGDGQSNLSILEASERRAIEAVLKRLNWNRTLAAQELGISRITLWRKMRRLSISPRPR